MTLQADLATAGAAGLLRHSSASRHTGRVPLGFEDLGHTRRGGWKVERKKWENREGKGTDKGRHRPFTHFSVSG